jgi:hypothetical protein
MKNNALFERLGFKINLKNSNTRRGNDGSTTPNETGNKTGIHYTSDDSTFMKVLAAIAIVFIPQFLTS